MKHVLTLTTCLLFFMYGYTQISVTYTINANTGYKKISPYIFGSCNGGYSGSNFMRQGGNRITGYNWENNASNAGNDWFHQSDDYLTWVAGISSPQDLIPGIVTTAFIDSCNAANAFSAVTLQMAGYVAKDKNGTSVTVGETAPSARWCAVQNTKPTAFSLTPDLNDNVVYMDEYMNFLINEYGTSTTTDGVKAYILDNETTLWPSTHTRIHPNAPTCAEIMQRSIALSTRVKQMDANALVFGPESYGFYEYNTYQGAADWPVHSTTYPLFLSFYLDSMRTASNVAGHRLLDVLTVHWYPDVNTSGIFSADTSTQVVNERMQLPRSLWDNTYVEDGWIGQWYSSNLPILPTLQTQINTYYPNTLLGVTEYDYGGDEHISGGIAQAEALGGFARTGTSYASKWGAFSDFSLSAIKIYDDIAEPFTGYYIQCSSDNNLQSTVHCSVEDTITKDLHIIAINKNLDTATQAYFNITTDAAYQVLKVYWFDKTGTTIHIDTSSGHLLAMNVFSYTMNPGSVYHFVLRSAPVNGIDETNHDGIKIFPNPVNDQLNISFDQVVSENIAYAITDVMGKTINTGNLQPGNLIISTSLLSKGSYFLHLNTNGKTSIKKFVKN